MWGIEVWHEDCSLRRSIRFRLAQGLHSPSTTLEGQRGQCHTLPSIRPAQRPLYPWSHAKLPQQAVPVRELRRRNIKTVKLHGSRKRPGKVDQEDTSSSVSLSLYLYDINSGNNLVPHARDGKKGGWHCLYRHIQRWKRRLEAPAVNFSLFFDGAFCRSYLPGYPRGVPV